jgi:hypothetical protein
VKNPLSRKKPADAVIPSPWLPAGYTSVDVAAIQALNTGTASPEQQARALKWIIESACRTYDLPYRPGTEGQRDTDFACGMQHVGYTIVKMLRINIIELARRENAEA